MYLLLLIIGLAICLYGIRIRKLILAIQGLLSGFFIGCIIAYFNHISLQMVIFFGLDNEELAPYIILAVVLAVLCAILFAAMEKLAAFLNMFISMLTLFFIMLMFSSMRLTGGIVVLGLLITVVCAWLAARYHLVLLALSISFTGALVAAFGMCGLVFNWQNINNDIFERSQVSVYLVFVAIATVVGFIVQYRYIQTLTEGHQPYQDTHTVNAQDHEEPQYAKGISAFQPIKVKFGPEQLQKTEDTIKRSLSALKQKLPLLIPDEGWRGILILCIPIVALVLLPLMARDSSSWLLEVAVIVLLALIIGCIVNLQYRKHKKLLYLLVGVTVLSALLDDIGSAAGVAIVIVLLLGCIQLTLKFAKTLQGRKMVFVATGLPVFLLSMAGGLIAGLARQGQFFILLLVSAVVMVGCGLISLLVYQLLSGVDTKVPDNNAKYQ